MMQRNLNIKYVATLALAWTVGAGASVVSIMAHASTAAAAQSASHKVSSAPVADANSLDRTGRARVGKASFYADRYAGRKMADGTPMRPDSNNAASITLPLGTTAKVTNLETGKSALVTIRDRGPYVKGRIIDLSPATARRIGLDKKKGLAQVQVLPIAVPLADGTMNFSAAALMGHRTNDPS